MNESYLMKRQKGKTLQDEHVRNNCLHIYWITVWEGIPKWLLVKAIVLVLGIVEVACI